MRVLLLPGWGFRTAVFKPLTDALGSDFHIDSVESSQYGNDAALPVPLVDQAAEVELLIGWSLGSLVALQLALARPAAGRRLVLLAPTPAFTRGPGWRAGMPEEVFRDFSELAMADPAAGLRQFVRLNYGIRMASQNRTFLADNTLELGDAALKNGLARLASTDLRDSVSEVSERTLVMNAADDRLINPVAGKWLAEHLARAELQSYDNGGHAFFTARPVEVAERIQQWVQ